MIYKLPMLLRIIFGGTRRAKSIGKLATKCGIDPGGLERTVTAYNAGKADDGETVRKSAEQSKPLVDGPFTAINVSIGSPFSLTLMFTLGGLVVDEESGLVKRADGSPIAGLYAAGRTAVGLCTRSYISGTSIGDCVFSGRRAARHMIPDGH